MDQTGLRARKKARTRQVLSDVAIELFLERGFDRVSVADIAEAAEVSRPTVFAYFSTKEDLVLHRLADHEREAASVVCGARPLPPIPALRQHFREGLERRDPVTGLNDHPQVVAFHQLVVSTEALRGRLSRYTARQVDALVVALRHVVAHPEHHDDAPLLASHLMGTQHVLATENWKRIRGGSSADDLYAWSLERAEIAFEILARGAPDPYQK